jgi:uncharacterized peroxidase-related enzyme
MPFFKCLPDDAGVGEVFRINPAVRDGFSAFSQALMRGESPLTEAERETIAAYTSALNACRFCYGGHAAIARRFGVEEGVFDALMADIGTAPVADRFKPILRFVKKLTLEPYRMVQADADAVFAAGWSERALHDAILVCARFNFMNRLTLGHGLDDDPARFEERTRRMSYNK